MFDFRAALPTLTLLAGCAITPSLADGPGELVCELKNVAVQESSGLARGANGLWWTHNDSGGTATLHGFDDQCTRVRKVKLEGANAVDWEEAAAFDQDGKRWLLVADTGTELLSECPFEESLRG